MAHTYKISDLGLSLIKAYEGFRAVEVSLVSGQRVIGYGHLFQTGSEPVISQVQAEELLKDDLGAYEDLINHNIFAPLNQSQFDALVSFSFNIGPKAFLSSHVRRALNNGRPLDAAHGFDQWCRSNIDGKTYIIDALVRRRTAEKALFLKVGEGVASAPRHEIPPQSGPCIAATEDIAPVFDQHGTNVLVDRAPYVAHQDTIVEDASNEKKGIYELSGREASNFETGIYQESGAKDKSDTHDAKMKIEAQSALSPVARAAEEVSARLDRLIADVPDDNLTRDTTQQAAAEKNSKNIAEVIADIKAANEGARENYRRPANNIKSHVRASNDFIQKEKVNDSTPPKAKSFIPYWIALIVGAILLGGGGAKWWLMPRTPSDVLQQFAAPVATIIGGMIVLGSLYYLAKTFTATD